MIILVHPHQDPSSAVLDDRGQAMKVLAQDVRVYVFEVSEMDLVFGFGTGVREWQLHGNDLVVGHTQVVHCQSGDGG